MKSYSVILSAISSVILTAILWRQSILLTGVLAVICVIQLALYEFKYLPIFLATAILGPTVEIVCIHYGAWNYAHSGFLGIPYWLPFIWGLAGITSVKINEKLGYSRKTAK